MAKIFVKTKIESIHTKHIFEGLALMSGTKIVYYDQKVKTEIKMGDHVQITRISDDTSICLRFTKEVQATCILKQQHLTVPMKLELSYIKQEDKKIDIHYKLEDEMFKFHLKYEVVE